jgi:hypothetical protein
MKKFGSVLMSLGVLFLLACGSDDDSNEAQQDCQTCSFELDGENVMAEICDNEDGTITITADGEEETESLEGATFAEFIAAIELFGGTCN